MNKTQRKLKFKPKETDQSPREEMVSAEGKRKPVDVMSGRPRSRREAEDEQAVVKPKVSFRLVTRPL